MKRVWTGVAALFAAGLAAWLVARGVRGGVSFAAGAAISALSLWGLSRMTAIVQEAATSGRPPGARTAVHAFRIFLLGGAVYVILRVYEVIIPALVTGLLVAVTAITLEALYEFLYARSA